MAADAKISRESLAARDAADPLAGFRARFDLPDGVIYLDGNSLGALPRSAAPRLARVVADEWGRDLIRAWNSRDWMGLPQKVGDKIGRLIGAAPGQVVAADSTSVNLFKLLAAALQLNPGRRVILTEDSNFPTDLYVAQGLVRLLGGRAELRRVAGDRIIEALDEDVAVVTLTQVSYASGAVHDMAAVTRAAQNKAALVLWDLSHSAGALPVDLDGCGADLAVGCGYKYLNGGPGAPAYLYVARRHQDTIDPVLAGWMGHADPFAFDGEYRPAPGITRQLCGTPPVLALAALEEGVDLMLDADMGALRAKSMALTDLFIALVEQECRGFGIAIAGPREAARRGSQVSLRHAQGYAIMQALIANGVIGDFRAPDLMRFGFAPLYLRHTDVWDAVASLRRIMETGAWDAPEFKTRSAVT